MVVHQRQSADKSHTVSIFSRVPERIFFLALFLAGGLLLASISVLLIKDQGVRRLDQAGFLNEIYCNFGRKGSNAFIPLDEPLVEVQFAALLEALLVNDVSTARAIIETLKRLDVRYQLVQLDTGDEVVWGFSECVPDDGQSFRGWGSGLVRHSAECTTVYQAPHVRADQYSEEITLQAFIYDPQACVALFAGAHRNANTDPEASADVAHSTRNLFHALTDSLARRGQNRDDPYWFIQFHGSANRESQPVITGSNGARNPRFTRNSPLIRISRAVNEAGHAQMGVCGSTERFTEDRNRNYRLCGTENVQGDMLSSLGLRHTFMHFEIHRSVRVDFHRRSGDGNQAVLDLLAAIREELKR